MNNKLSPTLRDVSGRNHLNYGLDKMIQAHKENAVSPHRFHRQLIPLQAIFSPDEIASLLILAVNRLAGVETRDVKDEGAKQK